MVFMPLVMVLIHLILKMTTARVVEMSVTNDSLSEDYPHLDNHTRQTTDTPRLKPFTSSGADPGFCEGGFVNSLKGTFEQK